ncbi:MAG: 50S ribosome-binding GTPase, partial [Lachnospiraceae bacterium]|nr:50S ribosome-binding GTPase [Lachnospiraceae bacterium]
MKLSDLKQGEKAKITEVGGEGALRQHFLDMGLIPGAEVELVKYAPMGDPVEFRVYGYELTLRLADAERITAAAVLKVSPEGEVLKPLRAAAGSRDHRSRAKAEHPGLGEEGRYHEKETENPLPEGTPLTFALVGNQNSGKTTLFNQLTGSNQHVGNFPGVTVDRKDGEIRGQKGTLITDLPGIYSMSPYTSEEIVSRDFVLKEKPKAIVNIVDVTSIGRNLYLTMQLLEMGVPMVVALNMMDEMIGNGGYVDINAMEEMLGVPVVPISAAKNEGVDELVHHAMHVAKYQETPKVQDFCDSTDHGGAVHRCIHAVAHLIEDHAKEAALPVRFAAAKVIENDELVLSGLSLDKNETETMEHIVLQMENERQLD